MKLRPLQLQDAENMLEWMHDPDCVENLQANFGEKSLEDCKNFIRASRETTSELHLAIASEEDEYVGTVSLKHIDRDNRCAEFAIAIRASAMGKGYSAFGMKQMIEKGFAEMDLECVYWCVSPCNTRAVRFYDKNHYQRFQPLPCHTKAYSEQQQKDLIWYAVYKNQSQI